MGMKLLKGYNLWILIVCLLANIFVVHAQYQTGGGSYNNYSSGSSSQMGYDGQGRQMRSSKKDSLQHRDALADSITIFFKYFDSTRVRYFDSSLNDFSKKLRLPFWYNYMGNLGSATKSIIFNSHIQFYLTANQKWFF